MPCFKLTELCFIVNPNSGRRNIYRIIESIRDFDRGLSVFITSDTKAVKEFFEENIDKYKVFVIVGGDGSVHEAMKYLYGYFDKYICVVPFGSGNGFANELGFKRSIKSLIDDIKKGETMKVDIIELNQHKCINMARVGVDSYVAHKFSHRTHRGLLDYMKLTIESFIRFRPFEAKVKSNGYEVAGRLRMITIANTRQFGNGARIAPSAKPNDGHNNLVLIKPFPFYLYPVFTVRMFLGILKESRYISYLQVNTPCNIKTGYREYHVDGEPVIVEGDVEVKIAKHKIQIIKTKHNRF